MRSHRFGAAGPALPVIGQGTWNMELDGPAAVDALRCGLDLGLVHIDTAEMYGDGRVEELVGRAVAGRREQVFLVSKVLPENASRRGTLAACERSLARLRTDHLDAYLLHWPGRHPFAETLAAFEELVQAGKIRRYGVSNFDARELADAVALAGPGRIACNQVLYHLGQRAVEHALLPACDAHGVALVAYTPFGARFPGPRSRGGRVLAGLARTRGATPRQLALAFLVRHRAVLTIPKASRLAHVRENAGAGALELVPEEIARLERAFPRGARPRSLPMG